MLKHIKVILAPKSFFWKVSTTLCLLIILYFSLIHPPGFQKSAHWFWGNLDKFGHAIAYTALGTSLIMIRPSAKWLLVLVCFGYSLLLEIIQGFLPLRQFDLGDLLANALGCLIGFVFASMLLKNQ